MQQSWAISLCYTYGYETKNYKNQSIADCLNLFGVIFARLLKKPEK